MQNLVFATRVLIESVVRFVQECQMMKMVDNARRLAGESQAVALDYSQMLR